MNLTFRRQLASTLVGKRSVWFPSNSPTRRLLVFVHGWGWGRPVENTWGDFVRVLDAWSIEHQSWDILMYGYDCADSGIQQLAMRLSSILDAVWTAPDLAGYPFEPRSGNQSRGTGVHWQALHLVCHSMGAVVARRALLDKTRLPGLRSDDWSHVTKMTMFAPAHTGVLVGELLGSVVTAVPVISLLAWAFSAKYPCLEDIDASDRRGTLRQLAEHAVEQCALHPQVEARLVAFASRDKVVSSRPFPIDRRAIEIDGTDHQTICKPTSTFIKPVQCLVDE